MELIQIAPPFDDVSKYIEKLQQDENEVFSEIYFCGFNEGCNLSVRFLLRWKEVD